MLWGIEWYSNNQLDGETRHWIYSDVVPGVPQTFRTRREAREWNAKNFGYIRTRKDLRNEPHGWRMPKVKNIKVIVQEISTEES